MLTELPGGRLVDDEGRPATVPDAACARCGKQAEGIRAIITVSPGED
jgi:hypothetical protein